MTAKVWRQKSMPPPGFDSAIGLPTFQSHLLYNRGIRSADQVEPFLAGDSRLLNDPWLLPEMSNAVDRVERALNSGETIAVFGDFDTDGISGTALLTHALREAGARVIPYLPNRTSEGHGLNEAALRGLRQEGASLLITVDCASDATEEVAVAAALGLDTIITDHHSLPTTLPAPVALVNPHRSDSAYPFDHLTGAGLAYKLVEALYATIGRPMDEHIMELVALGTVADVAPLVGENRYLVKRGLEALNRTEHPGLRALVKGARMQLGALDTESLSFGLIPRLNAPGRLADPKLSLQLLTTSDSAEAEALTDELNSLNGERRRLTERAVQEARQQLEPGLDVDSTHSIIFVMHEHWEPGILGLIANRLSEEHYRPVVAVSLNGDACRASARSIAEFNITEALTAAGDLFTGYGGHAQAAGFTMPRANIPALKDQLVRQADESLLGAELSPGIDIECEISLALLDGENMDFIQSLAPFGEGNPAAVFLSRDLGVFDSRLVGRDERHLKMRVGRDGSSSDAVAFNQGHKMAETRGRVDLVYTAGIDTWAGRPKLQLTVVDMRPSA